MELALSGYNISESEGAGDCGNIYLYNRSLKLRLEAVHPVSLRGQELQPREDSRALETRSELWKLHCGKWKIKKKIVSLLFYF